MEQHDMIDRRRRWVFVAWAPYGRRSELLAHELGAAMHFIHNLKFQVPVYAPIKYVLQALRTVRMLLRERPAVVFVQTPPFVCGLIVWLYGAITGARFVLDHHTASFARRWDWALPIQKLLARRAITNIVTNEHWAAIVRSWSAPVLILPDPFVDLPDGEAYPVGSGFNVVFINTFARDEPIDAVLDAAAQVPDVRIYVTGSKKKKPASFFAAAPANVVFTDFVPDAQYWGLLRGAQAVLALTTRDHTLQGGGCEAVSLGKPLITSDWPYLRQLFARGTIYVPNTGDGIRDGIRAMQAQHRELAHEIVAFRQDRRRAWDDQFARLIALVAPPTSGDQVLGTGNESVQPPSVDPEIIARST